MDTSVVAQRRRGPGVRGLAVMGALLVGVGGAAAAGGGAGSAPLTASGTVAFTGSTASPGVWVCAPDGTGLQRLTPAGETWIGDDVSRGHVGGPVTVLAGTGGSSGRGLLYAIRADGSGTPVLLYTAADPARVHTGRFSRDGTKVAFLGNNGVAPVLYSIFVADVVRDGSGNVTGLANVTPRYQTSSQLARGMDFSRTGDAIVFSMAGDLWRLDLSTGAVSQLTSTAEVEAWPRWSSVDGRIAYERWTSASSNGLNGVICALDTADGSVRVVTTKKNGGLAAGYLSFPAWSSDSATLLYHAHDSSKSDLWQIAADGSGKAVNGTNNGATVSENYPAWGW